MKDRFKFKSPFGALGTFVDKIFMKNYLRDFLISRNLTIKQFAENEEKWIQILSIY